MLLPDDGSQRAKWRAKRRLYEKRRIDRIGVEARRVEYRARAALYAKPHIGSQYGPFPRVCIWCQGLTGHYRPNARVICPTCTERQCIGCGIAFSLRDRRKARGGRPGTYCSASCYRRSRSFGKSCAVVYGTCRQCSGPYISHGNRRHCSSACAIEYNRKAARERYRSSDHYRVYMREYMRRTRRSAISYWAIDKSPEAWAVASTYYELRQLIRSTRRA